MTNMLRQQESASTAGPLSVERRKPPVPGAVALPSGAA